MKVLSWLLGLLLVIIGGIYFIAFTASGNAIVSPILEEKINEAGKLQSKLNTFTLDMSSFEILLALDSENSIHAKGTYSLFSQSFDATYDVKLLKLENLEELTKKPLLGSLKTDGTAKGDLGFMKIDGVSDIALSSTTYHIELTDLDPTSIIAKMSDADLIALLELVGEKPYADAKLNLDVNFKNIKPHELDGDILFTTKDAKLNTALMNKDFELNIPKTDFTMQLDAKLKGDDIDYNYILASNLAKITTNGNIVPSPLNINAKYMLDIKELAVLRPITNADVRGAFNLHGTVKGTKEDMAVYGISDFAASDISFTAKLKDLKASSLEANIKKLQLKKVLYMVKQPRYANGIFDLSVKMDSLEKDKLKGTVISNVKNGSLNSKLLTKEQKYKASMPKTNFTLSTYSVLEGSIIDTKIDLTSNLASVDIKQARYDLKDKSLVTDYVATIPNLSKLYFIIERHLKGSLVANGDVKKDEKDLDVTVHTNIAGGKIDAKLHNDTLKAEIKSLQTIAAMKMLQYPPVFKSSLNGVLDYDLKKKKGSFDGNLKEGGFEENMAFSLVKQYAKIDMYKEKFKGTVSAKINKDTVLASFNLKSNTSSIKTVKTKINSATNIINSKIDIVANKHPVSIILTGNKSKPKVKIDAEEVVKDQLKKEINKKLGGFLKGLF